MSKYSLREKSSEQWEFVLPMVQELLINRGISQEEAHAFLNPSYDTGIHDPFLLKDMGKAVKRILKAISKKQKIIIYGDYDADGVPGGVVLHDFFKKIGYENFKNYIPHRHHEGFGLNIPAIEKFAEEKVDLIITIDCGIADVEKVARAKELKIDVIITDHHIPGPKLPKAHAIINPKQSDCQYPEKMLCGSGVIFKVVQGILATNRFDIKEGWEKWLLDMVGIATLSDMVPLKGENRIFAHFGLRVLRKTPRVGLLKLLKSLKVQSQHINEEDVGFSITPRINAASRMGVPHDAFTLLSTVDEVEADLLVHHLNTINDERKTTVVEIVKNIRKQIVENPELVTREVIVMGHADWKPALLGLAANTLMKEYAKPVFLWGQEGGNLIKGSCRSDGSLSLVNLMETAVAGTFVDFGGHHLAGGFSALPEKSTSLFDSLSLAVETVKNNLHEVAPVYIDMKCTLDEVNWDTWKAIEQVAPYGEANPKPLFLFEHVEVRDVKLFGKEKNHLEFVFQSKKGKRIPAIAFFALENPDLMKIKVGDSIDLVAHIEKSVFRSFPELRLRVVDILK